jgi:cysteinyl-tRNA synthetase
MALRVYNSLSRSKETFEPREAGKVGMYVCGPTVYDFSHVGHARVYVVFDVIRRWLEANYEVKYVQNFTDVDDKIIARANERGEDPLELSKRFADEFTRDCDDLGIERPDVAPHVSTHMQQIIDFVGDLIDKDMAYRVECEQGDDVYYRVRKFESYTALSGRDLDEMRSGARVGVDDRKEDPLDFALWKSAKPGEPSWDSPFGKGRPGWHIECSAMSAEHLGASFDIHGGGKDLIFPHHTNEIAQSEARHDGAQFAKYWLHNGFVNFAGEKMSKSLGNFFTIREVTGRVHPETVRFFLLTAHYRSPINFEVEGHCPGCDAVMSKDEQNALKCSCCEKTFTIEELHKRVRFPGLEEAERRLAYVYETRRKVDAYLEANEAKDGDDLSTTFKTDKGPFQPWVDLGEHLDDDFNTPAALADLAEMTKVANALADSREKELIGRKVKPADRARLLGEWKERFGLFIHVLGIGGRDPAEFLHEQREKRCAVLGIDAAHVEGLLKDRQAAREAKDFGRSDEIRDELTKLGVSVRDGKDGAEWSVR